MPSTTPHSQPAPSPAAYVLGTGRDETFRLGLQHRLWSAVAHKAWERAGIRPGSRVIDVGCGPGHAAIDIAEICGPTGRVVGVDESAPFLKELGEEAKARHLTCLERVLGDVQDLGACLPGQDASFDLAYVRWVLCFVKSPENVIAGLSRVVRPGGRVVIHDYFNYEYSIKLAPRQPEFERGVAAVANSWRARGGDPDIAGRLPGLFAEHGFDVTHFDVIQRTARSPASLGGGDTMWHWADTFFRTFTPKLVDQGFLTKAECDACLGVWDRACNNPSAFVLLPSVIEIIAVRR